MPSAYPDPSWSMKKVTPAAGGETLPQRPSFQAFKQSGKLVLSLIGARQLNLINVMNLLSVFTTANTHLEPVGVLWGLLRCQHLNEALLLVAPHVLGVCARQVAVEGCRVELREDIDLADVAVDAVADGDVDQAVVGTEGDRRLGALLGEGVEAGAGAAPQNDSEDTLKRGKMRSAESSPEPLRAE